MRKAEVIKHFGTQRAVADALGITPQAVSDWDDIIPEGAAYKIESVTDRALCVNPRFYQESPPLDKRAAT